MRRSVGETSPMTGEGNELGIGSTCAAVLTIVCTTEGFTDSTSPARRFLRGCVGLGDDFVDSPDESSFSNTRYFGLFRALFVVSGRSWCNTSKGSEVEGIISSVGWYLGGGAIINCDAVFCGAEVASCSNEVSGGARLVGTFDLLTRVVRAIFDQLDDIPLAVSRLWCFILRSPFWIRVKSLMWLSILASFCRFFIISGSPSIDILSQLSRPFVSGYTMSLFLQCHYSWQWPPTFLFCELLTCIGQFSGRPSQELTPHISLRDFFEQFDRVFLAGDV